MKINIVLKDKDAVVPVYGSNGAVCFDFYATSTSWVAHYDSAVFSTGLEMEVPEGYGLFIFSRSGHGFNDDVRLGNCVGVIDPDYRGEVKIKLAADKGPKLFKKGDRIAQGCILPVPKVTFNVVEKLSDTVRGSGGFGSTDRAVL
jgi:dUTP pyrophosphatase